MSDVTELYMKKQRASAMKAEGEKILAEAKKLEEEVRSDCEHSNWVRCSPAKNKCVFCGEEW